MKKILSVMLASALMVGLVGCGTTGTVEETEPTEETETEVVEETEEVTVEEVDAEEIEDEADESDAEYVTGTYKGMTFSLPGDWYYQGDDSAMSFISPDTEAMILLQSVDLSESDDEYNDEALDLLFEASFESIQAQYSDFQEESTADLTIAGCEAKEMTATVVSSDTEMSDDALVIYDEDGQYFYLIQYVVKNEVEENTSTYEYFLDSISFDAAQADDDEEQNNESELTDNTAEGNLKIIDTVQSEDGYDITYQKYYFYEGYSGDVRVNALVQIENTGSENLQLRSSSFSVSDDEGNLVDVLSTVSKDPDIILPGEYGYFYVNDRSIDGAVSVDGDYTVTPELAVKETDSDPVIYEVSDTTISEGKYDKADVMGRITNTTDEDDSGLWIAVVLFDKDDNPLGVYGTNVHDIPAGGTVSFEADALYLQDADFSFSDVDRYEVIAQT